MTIADCPGFHVPHCTRCCFLVLIIGKEFTSYSPLYNYPIQSSDIDIFIVSDLLPEFKIWPVENISAKCIVLPFNDKFVSMSLIHTLL
jgi:hypothetical protein